MKKASFFLFGLIFLICITQAHAIQTDSKGKTQTFESSKSGDVEHISSSDGQIIAAVSGVAIAGPSAQPVVEKQEKKEIFQIFFDNLQSFFKKLFHFFH